MSPTVTTPAMTQAGVILGTAAYMSPEQAKGRPADKRSDIWAFGCVLYEMLTGTRVFAADDVSETLAFVLTKPPDWALLPPSTPASLRTLLRRALEKDRKRRLADAADARLELDEAVAGGSVDAPAAAAVPPRSAWQRAFPWMAALAASVGGAAFAWVAARPAPPVPAALQRLIIDLPASAPYVGEAGGELALSPDGTRLVYAATSGGTRMLYMRLLDQIEAQPIRGTENGYAPFFSPDGQWIGFFTIIRDISASAELKKINVRGGPALTVSPTAVPAGAAWGEDNTIVFANQVAVSGGNGWGLVRVAAAGGTPSSLTTPDEKAGELRHGWPELLPDGKTLLFSIAGIPPNFDSGRVVALSLSTGKDQTVIEPGHHARYVPPVTSCTCWPAI